MKLSEFSTERALDVMCQITPHIVNFAEDQELMGAVIPPKKKNKKLSGAKLSGADAYSYGLKKIPTIIPLLLQKHRQDVFGLLAILNDTTPEKIAEQPILVTVRQIIELTKDDALGDFFALYWPSREELPEEEPTEDQKPTEEENPASE